MHPSIYNIQPKRLSELIDEVLAEIKADGGMDEQIRREKASLIDNIMRGLKLAQIYSDKAYKAMQNPVDTFDKLYDKDLDTLDAYSKAIDKHNTNYMRAEVEKNNRAEWNPPDRDIWR